MDDRDLAITAAKQRMANFRLRHSPPSNALTNTVSSNALPAKQHARSNSLNNSITNIHLSKSTINNTLPTDVSQENPAPSSPSPRSRPNSHHRRRSSVSTRRESAEMMGVTLPPETASDADGDQSELRRLALWTLEGKAHSDNAFIGGFTKVEIPELNAPSTKANFDVVQGTKSKPSLSAFGIGSALAGKRDSFGKLLLSSSSSLKDQLHTLMEEEEEEECEEENVVDQEDSYEKTTTSDSVGSFRVESSIREEPSYIRPAVLPSSRHRPANLTLRPLSLTPESLPLSRTDALPTPSPTPSPRMGGLKSLTLAPSPSPSPVSFNSSTSPASSRRQSLSASPSPQLMDYTHRRQSVTTVHNLTPLTSKRRSSISYKQSNPGDNPHGHLPTPGPTPTSPMPPLHTALPSLPSSSSSAVVPDLDRPLSPTEQAFLFRSHTSLLCRISDLEQAIAGGRGRLPPGAGVGLQAGTGFGLGELRDRSRSHERPVSITDMSVTSEPESLSSQPSSEMLQLVSDLKAERDELMRDAEGWRTRIVDLEKQTGTLTRRVEAERREGWVIRERLGLVEVEKKRVKEEVEKGRLECRRLEKALWTEEGARVKAEENLDALGKVLTEERVKREMAEQEVDRLRVELEQLRARAEQADADLHALLVTPKVEVRMQMPAPRRLRSVDSQLSTSSTTDVEEYVPVGLRTLKLNAVEEEDEDRDLPRDVTSECGSESDNDELAHYEDDEELDDDLIFSDDQTSSSFGSIVRSNSHLLRLDLDAIAPIPAPACNVLPGHAKTGSMEKGWSFPQCPGQPSLVKRDPPKVDNFFECLDALDENDADGTGEQSTYDSASAGLFWRGAIQDVIEDEMPPFVLPAQPSPPRKGKEWKEIEAAKLEIVTEEENEEDDAYSGYSISSEFPEESTNNIAAEVSRSDPVTPRPTASATMLPIYAGTPTKHAKVRRTSIDLTFPGFKPYSGSVPVLKAPPRPKRVDSPGKGSPMTPTMKGGTLEPASKSTSPTMIPKPTYSSFTTPPKSRASISNPTLIPRLSVSPKSSPVTTMPLMPTPRQPVATPAPATRLTPSPKTVTTSMPPVFMPQPKMTHKMVTRSSLLPPKPPLLTRLSIPQQTIAATSPAAASHSQGLTAKLSQQMQSLTSLWSPWSTSPNTAGKADTVSEIESIPDKSRVRRYVSKGRQLERLRLRLQEEAPLAECASCRGGAIII